MEERRERSRQKVFIGVYLISDIGKSITDGMGNVDFCQEEDINMYRRFKSAGMKKGWLKPLTLWLIEKSPKNGMEIMDEFERMSMGWWRPSPGSIYPLLEEAVREGFTVKRKDGKYKITEKGREEMHNLGALFRTPRTIEGMIGEVESYALYFQDLYNKDRASLKPYRKRMEGISRKFKAFGA